MEEDLCKALLYVPSASFWFFNSPVFLASILHYPHITTAHIPYHQHYIHTPSKKKMSGQQILWLTHIIPKKEDKIKSFFMCHCT